MATYQTKSSVASFDAVQITEALAAAPGTWPAWLTTAWNTHPNTANAFFRARNGNATAEIDMVLLLNGISIVVDVMPSSEGTVVNVTNETH